MKIAAACERVPWEPPRNVLEAFHAIWFTQLMIWSEENATAYCIERIDQLLYPYYKAEKEAKTIDDTQMQELFDCFWIKLAEMIYFISDETAQAFAGYQPYHGVAVGGCREDGSDAVNSAPAEKTLLKMQNPVSLIGQLPFSKSGDMPLQSPGTYTLRVRAFPHLSVLLPFCCTRPHRRG